MREQFETKDFVPKHLHIIAEANKILIEYNRAGYTMTLRQLHYQFVARKVKLLDGEPYQNKDTSYDMLGKVMTAARFCGLVDWTHMEDRLRELEHDSVWDSPSQIIEAVADQYREDVWKGQPYRPEVWIEKDALGGVIDGVCKEFRIDYFACRGYVSASAHYKASKRWLKTIKAGQKPVVFHLGDHDPSGLDMTRENAAKFKLLTGRTIEVVRLALNFDQVELYNPPPNPAKLTDVRAPAYVEEFGYESWELDALEPQVITELIREAVEPRIVKKKWDAAHKEEEANRNRLELVSKNWDDVVERLEYDQENDDE